MILVKFFKGTLNGRPVEFCQAMWRWTFCDVPGHLAVEKVPYELECRIRRS